jgi:penicillin-binding protein 1C
MSRPARLRTIVLLLGVGVPVALAAALWLAGPPALLDDVPFSRMVRARDGSVLRLLRAADGQYRLRVALDEVPPELIEATLLQEDRHFREHPGVNPVALVRAAWATYVAGARRQGGSTLTMQLARLRSGLRTRSPWGKLAQVGRALQLEAWHDKDALLEAYLNLAPYGGNVQGVGAAAWVYFGKAARDLTLPEILTLVPVPMSPKARRPGGREPEALQRARGRLAAAWLERHPGDATLAANLALPVAPRGIERLPFGAPHAVDLLLAREPHGPEGKGPPDLTAALDPDRQALLERLVSRHVARLRPLGLENAAALLVDTRTLDVLACVGSADWHDRRISGQVNGVAARRSPGSALKPFLYALALDQGLLHPFTLLKDLPHAYGSFDPENFDRAFLGPIHATDALVQSRNVPAVMLAAALKQPSFHGFLQRAGIGRLRDASVYGLSIALGGVEVTLEELVGLYAMLARGGVGAPLRWRLDAPPTEGPRLLSPEAAFLVLDMLRSAPRPDLPLPSGWQAREVPVAWKTGTSNGFRDAWTVGVIGPYALGVWVGHFDGRPNPALVGREVAAPLFFDVADALSAREPGLRADWATPAPGLNVRRVDVCALSGQLPGPACPHVVATWFVPGVSPIRPCDLHRVVHVDPRTGRRACGALPPGVGRDEVYEFWPSDLLDLFRQAGVPRREPPPFEPGCPLAPLAREGAAPRITSPAANLVYTVSLRSPTADPLPLRAVVEAGVRTLHWFVDDRYVGPSDGTGALTWPLEPGEHSVVAVDDQGRSDARRVRVEVGP